MLRKKVVDTFRKILPPLSKTEKEALESGTVGWDGELMSGHPDWSKLFELKKPNFTEEEQAFLAGPVEDLCKILVTWDIQKENDLPKEAWDLIKREGFMGLEIPKEYGGKGFSSQMHSAVVMKLSSRNVTGAVTVMVPNSLGPAKLIHEYGTKEQKDYYLPRLASGEEIPCFALTEPNAGSDAGAIEAKGVVVRKENGEIGIRLNWEKRYITLGPVATLVGLAFKLEDPDHILGDKTDLGITVAVIPRETEGVEIGDRHKPMDLPFQNGPNKGKDVYIALDKVIGGAERAGQGWKMLMECLAVGRSLSLPAQSVAAAKLMSYTTGSYARTRKQFNSPISKFEGIEEPLARIAGLTYMMNAARLMTLQMVDQGGKPAVPSAIVKYHLTEGMRQTVNDGMDIFGGKAVMNGPENFMADVYKGIPVAITVEGANIMTRNLIIFGQGSVRAHPYLLKEMEAAAEPDTKKAFNTLVKTIGAHVWNTMKSAGKSFFHGITGARFSKAPKNVDKKMKRYYQQINRLCASFNLAADATLGTLGGKLKFKERTSARLGDVYSNLYLATSVLWHYEQQGRKAEDLPLVNWACTHALSQAEKAMDQLLKNHPSTLVGKALRPFIFPFGKHFDAPSDKMDTLAADVIRNPGAARDDLTSGIFKPLDEKEPLGKLELAFRLSVESEAVEKKIYTAIKSGVLQQQKDRDAMLQAAVSLKVIDDSDVALLKQTDIARRAVVMVDSFPADKKKTAEAPKV